MTGGGQTAPDITFGFAARSSDGKFLGHCNVVDHVLDLHVRCLTVDSYAQTANTAVFRGQATINEVTTTYRIEVQDNAEPGRGADSFTIQTGTGYTAGGILLEGNVQVHKQLTP